MTTTKLIDSIDIEDVRHLLVSRSTSFIRDDDPKYLGILKGVATEVISIVGANPPAGTVRDLAEWAITLGVAAFVDESIAPEQVLDDDQGSTGSSILQRKYLAVLAQLRGLPASGEEGALPANVLLPLGSFPDPLPDLDGLIPDRPLSRGWLGPGYTL